MEYIKKKDNTLFLIVFVFLFIFFIFSRFYPNDPIVLKILDTSQNFFKFDLEVKNSILKETTFYFKYIYKKNDDFIRFIIFFVLSFLNIIYFYLFFKKFSNLKQFEILSVLICLCSIDHFLLLDLRSPLVYINKGYQTYAATLFFGPIIYYGFSKKVVPLFLFAFLGNLISVKAIFFPTIIFFFYLFICRKRGNDFFLFLTLIISLLFLFGSPNSLDKNLSDRIFVLENFLKYDANESSLVYQPIKLQIVLLFSFLTFYFFLLKNNNLKKINKIILIFSILLIVFGELYNAVLYKIYPDVRISQLSVVRNLQIYQLFFVINLILFIFTIKNNFRKYLFLIFIILFDFSLYNEFNKLILITIICVFLIHLKYKFELKTSLLILILQISFLYEIGLNFKNHYKSISFKSFKENKIIHQVSLNNDLLIELERIKNCNENFYILVFEKKNNKFIINRSASYLAKKPYYYTEPRSQWTKKNFELALYRNKNAELINNQLNKNSEVIKEIIKIDAAQKMIKENVLILISDNKQIKYFNSEITNKCKL